MIVSRFKKYSAALCAFLLVLQENCICFVNKEEVSYLKVKPVQRSHPLLVDC